MAVIVQNTATISTTGNTTLYSAVSAGTINIRVCNKGTNDVTISITIGSTIEHNQILKPGQVLLEMGEVINTGESVVINVTGTSPAISCRVSGWTE